MTATSGRVLTGGSINTDLVVWCHRAPEAGETITGQRFDVFGGGKGANQTLASARSGAPTSMLGAVGDDDFGRQRLADLQNDGVDCTFVGVTGAAASGVALITVEDGGENRIAFVPGATGTVPADRAGEAVAAVKPSVILATLELPADTIQALIDAGRAAGATIAINATPEPAAGKTLSLQADVLIVNETEATELLGGDAGGNWDAVAAGLQALGPTTVLITLGPDGVVGRDADGGFHIPALKVEVVDTTGAGDAFCGAFAARLAAGADMRSAARAGAVAGSLAVTKPGAQPSQPTWDAIRAHLD
jgi:ribokinase